MFFAPTRPRIRRPRRLRNPPGRPVPAMYRRLGHTADESGERPRPKKQQEVAEPLALRSGPTGKKPAASQADHRDQTQQSQLAARAKSGPVFAYPRQQSRKRQKAANIAEHLSGERDAPAGGCRRRAGTRRLATGGRLRGIRLGGDPSGLEPPDLLRLFSRDDPLGHPVVEVLLRDLAAHRPFAPAAPEAAGGAGVRRFSLTLLSRSLLPPRDASAGSAS